jgi:hypothetical protein
MEIIDFQDKRWLVKYKTMDSDFDIEKIELFKVLKLADLVLKKDSYLFFVEEIPELQFIDIP